MAKATVTKRDIKVTLELTEKEALFIYHCANANSLVNIDAKRLPTDEARAIWKTLDEAGIKEA